MRWRDLDGSWWTIPANVAKNGLPHRVPLSKAALDVLNDLHEGRATNVPDHYVFAGIRGTRQRRGALAGLDVENVRPHDFRRTAASRMASAGVPRLVIAKVLNHVDTGITAVYDRHGYDAEKRPGLDTWARTLTAIPNGKRGKVLSMRWRA